jgi:hypothetical protein
MLHLFDLCNCRVHTNAIKLSAAQCVWNVRYILGEFLFRHPNYRPSKCRKNDRKSELYLALPDSPAAGVT